MKKFLLSAVLLTAVCAAPAYAQRVSDLPRASAPEKDRPQQQIETFSNGIVAVVNESVITGLDLRARMALAILSSGMPDSPEVQKKLLPQVLRGMIDEQLQLQEGKKQGISVSPADVSAALSRLAEDNKIPGGDMRAFLRKNGIPPSTLETQIKATLTWHKVISQRVRPLIDIGDDEVEAVVQRMKANAGKPEYLVSEIYLAADKPEDEGEVKALAEKLVEQIKGGVSFGAMARQFSQGLGAASGGDIGWIQLGQLAPEIDRALPNMQKGMIAGPIRSAGGYHLIAVRDKRTIAGENGKNISVKLQQGFRPFGADISKEALLREAKAMQQGIKNCDALKETMAQKFPAWRHQDLGEVKMEKMPAWLSDKITSVSDGEAADPLATDKGALVVFVCGRTVPENFDLNAIRNAIGSEKMELMARRSLRDLRKNAFIDVRLKGSR